MSDGVLRKLGLRKNWIYETIVTTHSRSSINSAPVGIWTKDLKSLNLKLYKRSTTFKNIIKNGFFVINFPSNLGAFYDALSSKKLKYIKTRGGGYALPRLSFLEMMVKSTKSMGDAVEFKAYITRYRIKENTRFFNRAQYLTLEYLIKKTKPKPNKKELAEYRSVVNKVAPKSIYIRMVNTIKLK